MNPKFDEAVEFLFPRIKARMEECTLPWQCPEDGKELEAKYGLHPRSLGVIYTEIGKRLGKKVECIRQNHHEMAALIQLIAVEGDATEEVRRQLAAKYPSYNLSGHAVRSAKIRLGLIKTGDSEDPTPLNPAIFEGGLLAKAGKIQSDYLALCRQEEQLERALEEVRTKKEKYKPMAAKLNALKDELRSLEDGERQVLS